ncbi:DUF5671 domain-containing protein [Acidicapsa dinghuensis]|uniref:DUF5671 domain-containing protein n=1 Tax=Acidicapsa dinghuensis TaxID=2218256 RepID=A0ABW1ECH7_9BACT|nr:DUF5671 domain-containing protein [Acidicapsa dinghuensis]
MADEQTILRYVSGALDAGVPYDAVVGMLRARGWRDREIYKALGVRYSDVTGMQVPLRASPAAGAKDAFLYLLAFSTLATWTIASGSLAFRLIERWFHDPLFSEPYQQYQTYEITWSLAAILIAYPLYMLITRTILREAAVDPDKLDSSIRKWLTYMALVIAASIFMGDLITALAFLLRGELTSRFVAKSIVVLLLSGGVFYYYFGGLRKTEPSEISANRDRLMAVISAVAVTIIAILGFMQLGTPRVQREIRADSQRVTQLYYLTGQIRNYWNVHGSQLPSSLGDVPGAHQFDPVTHAQYEYIPGIGSQYQLCAVFTAAKQNQEPYNNSGVWDHSAGHACFSLDAKGFTPYPPQ